MGDQYIDNVREWPTPQGTKAVERFFGFANYHRNLIARFSEIAAPLYAVTRKAYFRWGEAQQQSFDALIEQLIIPPVIAIPTTDGNFVLDTDPSDLAIGGELSQIENGQERTIAYASAVSPLSKAVIARLGKSYLLW